MVQVIKTAILAAFLSTALLAAPPQGKSPPELDSLPTCDSTYEQQVRVFTEGDSSTDCDIVGGGSTLVRCVCDNGTWIVDAGSHDNLDRINLNTSATPEAHTPGNLYWCDAADDTLCFDRTATGNTVQVGQEIYLPGAVNKEGSTITDGQAVYVSGAIGQTVEIKLARADVLSTSAAIGLATHDILNNQNGAVTTFGLVRGLDTSLLSVGAIYLSTTVAGGLTNTVPTGPDSAIFMGFVTNSHPDNGEIFVNVGVDFSETIVLLSAYLTGGLTVEDGIAVNSDSDATGDFSVQGDTVADILKCLVSTDTCTYKGTELGSGGGGGSPGGVAGDVQMNDGASGFSPAALNDNGSAITSTEPILVPDGASGANSIASSADPTGLGIRWASSGGIMILGSDTANMLDIRDSGATSYVNINGLLQLKANATGSAANYRFVSQEGTGLGLVGATPMGGLYSGSRLAMAFSDALTPAAASASFMDDGTSQQAHFECAASNADNCFEVTAASDGAKHLYTEADGDVVVGVGQLLVPDGTAAFPSVAATTDGGTTGNYYEPGGNFWVTAVDGARVAGVNGSGFRLWDGKEFFMFSDSAGGDLNIDVYSENDKALFAMGGRTAIELNGTDLTPAVAPASFMDDGTSQQAHFECAASNADNCFEVTAASDGAKHLYTEADGDVVVGTGQVLAPNGTTANPSFSFSATPSAGMYLIGTELVLRSGSATHGLLLNVGGGDFLHYGSAAISPSTAGFLNKDDTNTHLAFPGGDVAKMSAGAQEVVNYKDVLIPGAASASFMDDGTSQQSHFECAASNADNCFEVTAAADGAKYLTVGPTGAITAAQLITASGGITASNGVSVTSGVLGFASGSLGNPSLAMTSDTNTGFYRVTADTLGIVAGGVLAAKFNELAGPITNTFYGTNIFDGEITIGDIITMTPKVTAPVTCSIGQIYSDTSGALCHCSATDTWEALGATGSCV